MLICSTFWFRRGLLAFADRVNTALQAGYTCESIEIVRGCFGFRFVAVALLEKTTRGNE